ncbi:MAG: recombinase family protein [Firmicutes bacterium HGW-Firmicutes-9]|jgi:DNA invertase Pin-like site-specific DNA recombinase|nr:MAG: recombinase family protein [Firmicutes bacterium HGW-Firmicutes-9]
MNRVIHKVQPTIRAIPQRKRVAAYARVSNDKESMVESLAAQVSHYSAHIQRNPQWIYVGVYADEGLTGTKDARPEFQRLIADCYAGKIDMVITKSLSRFSRNTLDTLNILRELKQRGVDVFFERENIHSNSGDGELMLSILSSFAQEESRSISENCKWRIREKMKQGELVGLRDMYGYVIDRNIVSIEPQQAQIVLQIFDWYLSGDSSVVIAKRLNAAGEQTLNHAAWSAKHVREILTNEKYTGNALLQKSFITDHLSKRKKRNHGEAPQYYVEQSHPAIVDIDTFQAAQEMLKISSERYKPSNPVNARYPFTGRIICGNCGKNFQRKTTKERISWQCATYLEHGKSACPAKQIPESALLDASAEALGFASFDETDFLKRVLRIEVLGANTLRFVFTDGTTTLSEWKDRSRSESWTDEMKQAAKARSLAIREAMYSGSSTETSNEN